MLPLILNPALQTSLRSETEWRHTGVPAQRTKPGIVPLMTEPIVSM